ncbi:MAG TPA: hypothetical protein VFQ53_12720 [Kofleriaceae bacterium]|nr:hypothetical protein [Kofleriaceae bacterium]
MTTYRDDLAALAARHDALAAEVATKTRELEATAQLLDDAKARARLPVLDNIRVAAPCTAEWSKMVGDDRVRHCGDCKKNVYNLSAMTRDEAQALIVEREGDLCVRYFQRKDGTILTSDCTIGISRRRRRRIVAAGAAAMLAGGGAFAWKALRSSDEPDEGMQVLGGIESSLPDTTVRTVEPPPPPPESVEMLGQPIAPPQHHIKMGKMILKKPAGHE